MIAWKSQSQAMEEPRSINPTGLQLFYVKVKQILEKENFAQDISFQKDHLTHNQLNTFQEWAGS